MELTLQQQADMANFLLKVQSAQLYGLMTGDPNNINQERCIKTIEMCRQYGIIPDEDYICWEMIDTTKRKNKFSKKQVLAHDWEISPNATRKMRSLTTHQTV